MSYEYPNISRSMREALDRYHYQHIATGGFTQAVIENNLQLAVNRAVGENRNWETLQELCWYVSNELPAIALDFVAWTTCRCEEVATGSTKPCLVHTFPEELLRELRDA